MGVLFRLVELLLLALPLIGLLAAGIKAISAMSRRTAQKQLNRPSSDEDRRCNGAPIRGRQAKRRTGRRSSAPSTRTRRPMHAGWSTNLTRPGCWNSRS